MKITVFYVGSSLLAPLVRAEADINQSFDLGLRLKAHNCTLPISDHRWPDVERDIAESELVFLIHVTDPDNAARLAAALDRYQACHQAVVVINCMPDLMQRMRMGRLRGSWLTARGTRDRSSEALTLLRKLGAWMSHYVTRNGKNGARRVNQGTSQYLKLIEYIPGVLRFVPATGRLKDVKHYLQLFCYFMQPTPTNIRQMLLYAIKHYIPGYQRRITVGLPESHPVVGIYHPDAPALFQSFDEYLAWYNKRSGASLGQEDSAPVRKFDPQQAIGFLLLRPQLVSGAHRHYDALIRACEAEGLSVLPIISTLMDNRQAGEAFLVDAATGQPRVSQIVSLTGFSFVGGPGRNDSAAAVAWLSALKRPLRTAISMDMQTIEQWASSRIGLNPVQTTMQVAIPEIDGATEPLVFAGVPSGCDQPEPIPERISRIARRLARWNRLQRLPRAAVRLGFIIYCFPPNKGNVGTAADLDVFPSLWEILRRLQAEGYSVQAPRSAEELRHLVLGDDHSALGRVAYRLPAREYWRWCPYVEEIEAEWGPAPGSINAHGSDILIYGAQLGHVFIGIQPTFGYEGDPTRLLMAESGAPHHGFMGFYCYLNHIFCADALVHVGTHGALEFMPGKQVGLSDRCWPDRLIGDFPNIYLYSVNNPSEGTIAKRRSYAELISYLTPPMENAGLYKELASLKELIMAYRQSPDRHQRDQLYELIYHQARALHLEND